MSLLRKRKEEKSVMKEEIKQGQIDKKKRKKKRKRKKEQKEEIKNA